MNELRAFWEEETAISTLEIFFSILQANTFLVKIPHNPHVYWDYAFCI